MRLIQLTTPQRLVALRRLQLLILLIACVFACSSCVTETNTIDQRNEWLSHAEMRPMADHMQSMSDLNSSKLSHSSSRLHGALAQRPVATYSIVAFDEATGELGVAVQSHWFSVGPIVPWSEAGVGAVATQSLVDPSYGPRGLDLMREGKYAPTTLAALVAEDGGRAVRQIAMIDAHGHVAAHTGENCIAEAGHIVDEEHHFSVQANLMHHDTVWPAMADAYRAALMNGDDLADRLVAALAAAQDAGGDIRGKQSAALVVVVPDDEATGKPWVDRKFDLRIEDHPEPIEELRRLVRLQRKRSHPRSSRSLSGMPSRSSGSAKRTKRCRSSSVSSKPNQSGTN